MRQDNNKEKTGEHHHHHHHMLGLRFDKEVNTARMVRDTNWAAKVLRKYLEPSLVDEKDLELTQNEKKTEKNKDKKKAKKNKVLIPPELLAKAHGIGVVRMYRVGALLVGLAHTGGIAVSRLPDGKWSGPVALSTEQFNFGIEAGIEAANVVIVFTRSPKIILPNFLVVSDSADLVIGPWGGHSELYEDYTLSKHMILFTQTIGLFGGVSIDVNYFHVDPLETKGYYISDNNDVHISTEDILDGKVTPPPGWEDSKLHKLLVRAFRNIPPPPPHSHSHKPPQSSRDPSSSWSVQEVTPDGQQRPIQLSVNLNEEGKDDPFFLVSNTSARHS